MKLYNKIYIFKNNIKNLKPIFGEGESIINFDLPNTYNATKICTTQSQ